MTTLEAIQRTTDENMAVALIAATVDMVDEAMGISFGDRDIMFYIKRADLFKDILTGTISTETTLFMHSVGAL